MFNKIVMPSEYPLVCRGIPSAVYLLPSYNKDVDDYMHENWESLFYALIDGVQIPFYYPFVSMKNEANMERFMYNHPYLDFNEDDLRLAIEQFTKYIVEKNNLDLGDGGIALFDYHDSTTVFDFFPINPEEDFEDQLEEYQSHLQSKIQVACLPIFVESTTREHVHPTHGKLRRINENSKTLEVEVRYYSEISFSRSTINRTSDEKFDKEALKVTEEIEDRVDLLLERGYANLLFSFMERIQQKILVYSKLLITKDYRLYLQDWNMQEVKMAPLPKSVFILFLRHPEGILFKELSDYKEEIRSIYLEVTNREQLDGIDESIDALVDPMNNSINEKCSRIRMSFIELVSPEIAKQYCVVGKKGEPKRIELDRNMVIWEE